jgi:T4 bacteriophage base plate protein
MENSPQVPKANPNPLSKFFRQPAIYIKLPSGGKYWDKDALEMPITGEIPVYPMTARDEITLRTPDALMNGTSVVEVVQSCCPSIKNAWRMPGIDVDTVLIAIRIASYGHEMDVDTNCPHCKHENNHALDLRVILSQAPAIDFTKKIDLEGLKIKLKPQEFFGINRQNAINFEEQRIMTSLRNDALENDAKAALISESINKLITIGIDTVTDSTEYVELDDGTMVNNRDHVLEFYKNADGKVIRKIQEALAQVNQDANIKTQKVACTSCSKEYQVPLEFDYSNFFELGS